jgi:hypothetical protein
LKTKLKGRHFGTIEVIAAESQTVLNTLTEHDFQDAFKNDKSAGKGVYARRETTSNVTVASRPKLVFYQMAESVPETGWLFLVSALILCISVLFRAYVSL